MRDTKYTRRNAENTPIKKSLTRREERHAIHYNRITASRKIYSLLSLEPLSGDIKTGIQKQYHHYIH